MSSDNTAQAAQITRTIDGAMLPADIHKANVEKVRANFAGARAAKRAWLAAVLFGEYGDEPEPEPVRPYADHSSRHYHGSRVTGLSAGRMI